MLRKEFLSYNTVRNNAINLAYRIAVEFGLPDIIYVSLRGGAYVGNVISEYFKILAAPQKVIYAAVVARAYTSPGQRTRVKLEGWTYNPKNLKAGWRVLLIDDIFDTGYTLNYLASYLLKNGVARQNLALVVHDYKIRAYAKKRHAFQPDFYCRRHIIEREEDDFWIHYLSHELQSLSDEEKELYYLKEDSSLAQAFAHLKKKECP